MHIAHGLTHGQVLQRRRKGTASATLSGTGAVAGSIHATITAAGRTLPGWKRRAVGRVRAGKFTATIDRLPVGGPYRITLSCGAAQVVVERIYVGDVWLLAGQSNMEGVGNMNRAPQPHAQVQACYMDGRWDVAKDPLHVLGHSPDVVHNPGQVPRNPADTGAKQVKGTGVGIPFGVDMVTRTGVPQGLICTAHGGTSMAQWDPKLAHLGGASLYGSMLRSVRATGQPVAGILWYQGCSDCSLNDAARYRARMERLVAACRRDLGDAKLPFVLVQIARVVAANSDHRSWMEIRELQRRLPETIPHTAVVAAIDLPLDDLIHISTDGYQDLGPRLARSANRLAHGAREQPTPQPLRFRRLSPRDGLNQGQTGFAVDIADAVGGLHAHGTPNGFTLVDAMMRPIDAIYRTTLGKDRILLETSGEGDRPDVQLVYGYGCNPICTIRDGRGEALPAFGPLPLSSDLEVTPFLRSWQVSRIITDGPGLKTMATPQRRDRSLGLSQREFPDNFCNRHAEFEGHAGVAVWLTTITAARSLATDLLVGYDGSIRVFLDGKQVFADPSGTNPALVDAKRIPLRLAKGSHELAIALDLNGGLAWGIWCRFAVPAKKRAGLPSDLPDVDG